MWRKRKIIFIAVSFLLFFSFLTTHGAEVRRALWKKAFIFIPCSTSLPIYSRARLRLSDGWVFFFCFVLILCVCVADFQFVKSIFASCCLHLCSLIPGHRNLKNLCVFLLQKRQIKMDGSETRETKNFLSFDVFRCCRFLFSFFQTFCFGVRCSDCCKQICFAFSLVVNLLVQRILVCAGIRICN